ncbi:hypothetical protein F442_07372 [Phytophthora nicotianae P10297]|uniref:Uncharacterized protein n=1 Tax=Phytophthora nicotianae P10297 TaxID=1317064 RepID=W2ZHB0_PHYNI|nr:hypothetical protein F442_07372 [Phytophthora nicotianae P10297]
MVGCHDGDGAEFETMVSSMQKLQRWNTLSPSWLTIRRRSSRAHKRPRRRPSVGCPTISLHCTLPVEDGLEALANGRATASLYTHPRLHSASLGFLGGLHKRRFLYDGASAQSSVLRALRAASWRSHYLLARLFESLSRDGVFN